MMHGLYWLAANLALRRPVVLAVDDLHWADVPSLQWFDADRKVHVWTRVVITRRAARSLATCASA